MKNIYDINNHSSWGNTISWSGPRRIYGWFNAPKLKLGDIIISDMQSGKKSNFIIEKIDYKTNPSDMFFANVFPLCYVGDEAECLRFNGFSDEDWECLNRYLYKSINKKYTQDELENIFYNSFSEKIKLFAYTYGMTDLEWNDLIVEWLKTNKI